MGVDHPGQDDRRPDVDGGRQLRRRADERADERQPPAASTATTPSGS